MKINKINSSKRKYNYPYRPFFWSLNVKTVSTISRQDLDKDTKFPITEGAKPK